MLRPFKRFCVGLTTLAGFTFLSVPVKAETQKALAEHGAYLARAADCVACHTDPGHPSYGGGYTISSPLGNIIVPNISSSKKYGIGNWTEAEFESALRQGIAPRGRLYPAMPYTQYAHLSDADVKALYAYFSSDVEPEENPPRDSTHLPFPFNIRQMMIGWDLLFHHASPLPSAEDKPGSVERGRYLVEGLAHCSTCHTPRNLFMAEKSSEHLAGGRLGGWIAPNITSDAISGIGGWSEDELVTYLRQGAVRGKAQSAGAMAEAVSHSFRFMTDDDLRAIARYLKTVPAVRDPEQSRPAYSYTEARKVDIGTLDHAEDRSPDAMENSRSTDGQSLYVAACATCHQLHGEGTKDQFYPSLTSNVTTGASSPNNTIMAILKGVDRTTNTGKVFMPPFQRELNDAQIASVANYVFSHFGNPALTVKAEDVKRLRYGDNSFWSVRLFSNIAFIASICGVVLAFFVLVRALRRRGRR